MIDRVMPAWFVKAREIHARSGVLIPAVQARKATEPVTLYIYDVIGFDPWSETGVDPKDVTARLDEAKSAPLEVHINSPGGYVFDGIAIFNAIRSHVGPKTIYVDGIAASIASVIALAGDKVITNEGAMWMVHDPMGGMFVMGTADEIEDAARKQVAALRKVRENLVDIYVTATGRPLSEVSAWMTSETWMTADEALARGFTDEISKSEPAEPEKEKEAAKAPVLSFAQLRRDAIVAARQRAAAPRASPVIATGTK